MNNTRRRQYAALRRQVGKTPLRLLRNFQVPNRNRIWAKLESHNPTESAFDRVYPGLFELAERSGHIAPGRNPVVECSTGNAGASFAWAGRALGFECSVIIHEDAPAARVDQLRHLGARVIFSPAGEYGSGYVAVLNSMLEENRRAVAYSQEAPLYAITKIVPEARAFHGEIAREAVAQLRAQRGAAANFSTFVAAVGSGDLICGVAAEFRRLEHEVQVVGMESAEMPTVSSLRAGRTLSTPPLPVEDLMLGVTGTGLPMERLNIDFDLINRIEGVTIDEWKQMDRALAEQERLAVGRTSAGSLAAALKVCEDVVDSDVLTVFFDPRWKYGTEFTPRSPDIYTTPGEG